VELRDKIEKLIIGLGISSAKFADYIEVSRPILSHILTNRNKPSLDICQKISDKFPELGRDWFFDGHVLDKTIIQNIAKKFSYHHFMDDLDSERELNIPDNGKDENKIFNSQGSGISERKEIKVMIFYSDGTFETFIPNKN